MERGYRCLSNSGHPLPQRRPGRIKLTVPKVFRRNSDQVVGPGQLSSGEKQLLILLAEALLREASPVVYVADEPELSLHVEWQEKLITSLVELAQNLQVLVATHSPDIVGPYRSKVIKLGGDNG
jgi:predicted ATPase